MAARQYPGLNTEAGGARAAELARFGRWEVRHLAAATPAGAVAAAGALLDMLPEAGWVRTVHPSGVIRLHALLAGGLDP